MAHTTHAPEPTRAPGRRQRRAPRPAPAGSPDLRAGIRAPRAAATTEELWAKGAGMFNDADVSASKAIEFMEEHNFVEPTPAGVARLFREKAGPASKSGLDKREIGEYLAKLKPYNNEVRQAYVETLCVPHPLPTHAPPAREFAGDTLGSSLSALVSSPSLVLWRSDFTGKSFVLSLREFLNSFRLPGESMLIEVSTQAIPTTTRFTGTCSERLPVVQRLFSAWASRFYRNNPGDFAMSLLTEEKVAQVREAFDKFASEPTGGGAEVSTQALPIAP